MKARACSDCDPVCPCAACRQWVRRTPQTHGFGRLRSRSRPKVDTAELSLLLDKGKLGIGTRKTIWERETERGAHCDDFGKAMFLQDRAMQRYEMNPRRVRLRGCGR